MFPASKSNKMISDLRRGSKFRTPAACGRRGLTLIELMIASAIMTMVVGALAVLSRAVQVGCDYSSDHGEAVQHARVVLERITRFVNGATASSEFPGILVLDRTEGGYSFPDTLVVWHPATTAFDPKGRPRFEELVVFCTSPDRPQELLELTFPGNTGMVPPLADPVAWSGALDGLIGLSTTRRTVLTDRLRTASVDGSDNAASRRACARFHARFRPSDQELAAYTAGDVAWNELPWVQNVYGPSGGLRQVLLRIELQLAPGKASNGRAGVTFFDSAAVYYVVDK